MTKFYRRNKLDEALGLAGIVSQRNAYFWLLRMEKAGRLVSPRDPVTNQRKFTEGQIDEIVRAFSPNGSGSWKSTPPPTSETTATPAPITATPTTSETPTTF